MPESLPGVLVLCTGNSARSILGEAILAVRGAGRLRAYSAGSKPKGVPHPGALRLLERRGIATAPFASKSWNTVTAPGAPRIDIAITVCDNAAQESCPVFIGAPVKGHWGLPDPVKAVGTDAEKALVFAQTYAALRRRIAAFVELPFDSLSRMSLQSRVDAIGTDTEIKA
jgi:arsenate reductase